jgi:hypothetical protein
MSELNDAIEAAYDAIADVIDAAADEGNTDVALIAGTIQEAIQGLHRVRMR